MFVGVWLTLFQNLLLSKMPGLIKESGLIPVVFTY
jgi:hypothetical protein